MCGVTGWVIDLYTTCEVHCLCVLKSKYKDRVTLDRSERSIDDRSCKAFWEEMILKLGFKGCIGSGQVEVGEKQSRQKK